MTIPKITYPHIARAIADLGESLSYVEICNKAIEIALAEQQSQKALESLPENLIAPEAKEALGDWIDSQQESEYITAERAQELRGCAEYYQPISDRWIKCDLLTKFPVSFSDGETIKYRAIKQAQPEPVDPDAALRAEYANQVKEGTRKFYQWEAQDSLEHSYRAITYPIFFPDSKYRYADISCMVAKQGEPAKRMLRTEAQELQRQTDETHEWRLPNGSYRNEMYANGKLTFTDKGTYTYAPKATIKLDGKMVTPEQAAAEMAAKKKTHERFVKWFGGDFSELTSAVSFVPFDDKDKFEYEFRPKALKQVKWSDMPVGVMTNMGEFRGFYKVGNGLYVKNGFYVITERKYTDGDVCRVANQAEDMNLSPASEQPWIAVNGKFNKVEGLIYETKADAGFGTSDRDIACFKITGIAKGYVLGGAV